MPINRLDSEARLKSCKRKLHALFKNEAEIESVNQQINEVDTYYNLSYKRATTTKTVDQIVSSYESLIDTLTQVKKGTLTSEEALNKMSGSINSRKVNVIYRDLSKACEFMFWAATTISLSAAIFGIALPILVVQPVLGLAVATTIVGSMIKAIFNAISCFNELKAFSRHSSEYDNEAKLISFFRPERTVKLKDPIEDQLEHVFERPVFCN